MWKLVKQLLNLPNGSVDKAYEVKLCGWENQPLFRKYSWPLQLKQLRKNPDAIVTGRDYFRHFILGAHGDHVKNIRNGLFRFETGKIVEL